MFVHKFIIQYQLFLTFGEAFRVATPEMGNNQNVGLFITASIIPSSEQRWTNRQTFQEYIHEIIIII